MSTPYVSFALLQGRPLCFDADLALRGPCSARDPTLAYPALYRVSAQRELLWFIGEPVIVEYKTGDATWRVDTVERTLTAADVAGGFLTGPLTSKEPRRFFFEGDAIEIVATALFQTYETAVHALAEDHGPDSSAAIRNITWAAGELRALLADPTILCNYRESLFRGPFWMRGSAAPYDGPALIFRKSLAGTAPSPIGLTSWSDLVSISQLEAPQTPPSREGPTTPPVSPLPWKFCLAVDATACCMLSPARAVFEALRPTRREWTSGDLRDPAECTRYRMVLSMSRLGHARAWKRAVGIEAALNARPIHEHVDAYCVWTIHDSNPIDDYMDELIITRNDGDEEEDKTVDASPTYSDF